MSKVSLCILDDKIPVEHLRDLMIDDSSLIDGNVILHCLNLKDEQDKIWDWGDVNLRNFINTIKDEEDYLITGFKNHTLFFNYQEDSIFSPDIVVFDWDVGNVVGVEDPWEGSSKSLLKLLKSTYCLVGIFTAEDTEENVSHELQKQEFEQYLNRCFLIKKQDPNSAELLKAGISERKNHFSFEFGNKFRKASLDALNEIFIDLGKLTSGELTHYFNINEERDIEEFIAEKYHSKLNVEKITNCKQGNKWKQGLLNTIRKKFERRMSTFTSPRQNAGNPPQIDLSILEKIWSYRLYHIYPDNDKAVRKGDIITKDDQYFIVINSDCHLPELWKKNFGFVNVVPLYLIDSSNIELKDILSLIKDGSKMDYKQNSFSEKLGNNSEGSFCMPFIPIGTEYKSFIFFAKTLTYIKVDKPVLPPNEHINSKKFNYDYFTEYSRVCTLSEPFLTPVISNLLNSIAGHGCPDYNKVTKDHLHNTIINIFP